jgi:hypothetical protein
LSFKQRPTQHASHLAGRASESGSIGSFRLRDILAVVALIGVALVLVARHKPGLARASQDPAAHAVGIEAKPYSQPTGETGGASEGYGSNPVALVAPGAAAANARLSTDAVWLFGSKTQRGWSIYIPLICNQIGTDADVGTTDFALAVARWQRKNGLPPSGVLDSETWSAMVRSFQSQRIKDRAYPSPSEMVTAPPSEFYDPERPQELRQVRSDAYQAYKRMLAAATADLHLADGPNAESAVKPAGQYLLIISAFRSREYQDQLRKRSPRSGRAGLAVNSPHFSGCALDLYVGGEPVSTKDENRSLQTATPVYHWLVKNAARFGFRPYFYEPWHWEYCQN